MYSVITSTAAISPQGTVRTVRAVVQRVSSASVSVDGKRVASIGRGLLVLLGVRTGDGEYEAERLARKLDALRVFEDADGKMNLSVRDVDGELLLVSNFTLYGDARKGNRPSFVDAARPEDAEPLVERVRELLGAKGGVFGAHMAVELANDGPVTIVLEN
jgi:D-aminoacyl-tRNA deacylase